MTRFIDGPAKSAILHLQRSPIMLRVTMRVEKGVPVFDALDQIDDEPMADEKLYVYKLKSNEGFMHIDGRDKKTGKRFGRTEAMNSYYEYYKTQPTQDSLNTKTAWQSWCRCIQTCEEAAKLRGET